MNNIIILEPLGGLANRMRVIASGLWLAGILNKEVKLIWSLNTDLNCRFEELFEPIKNIEIINKKFTYRFFRSTEKKKNIKKFIIRLINTIVATDYNILEDADIIKIKGGELDIIALGRTNKTLYFRTCSEFGNNIPDLKQFIPKPDIQQKINECCNKFNDKTIGVHIRRTDHIIAIKQSPTELFINQMSDDLERNPEISFFLSTDDKQTEDQLKLQFGEKIMTYEKSYSRNSIQGIKDAVVDFYCLANTSKIYGSYWSSFSELSSKINGINLERLKINNSIH